MSDELKAYISTRIEELEKVLSRTDDDWIEGKFEAYCEIRDFLSAMSQGNGSDTPAPQADSTGTGERYYAGVFYEWVHGETIRRYGAYRLLDTSLPDTEENRSWWDTTDSMEAAQEMANQLNAQERESK